MNHVPMCKVCGEWEVGTFTGSAEFCSEACEQDAIQFLNDAHDQWERERADYIDNHMDDAEALASAGFGTDEDYGYYGDDF